MRSIGCLFVLLLLTACEAFAPGITPDAGPHELRVVTWNIHHGAGLDERVDVERLGAELKALQPDFVLLQEVDVGCKRSDGIDIPKVLAQQLGMHAAFAQNIPFQGGSYGNAILSRYPIESQYNLHYRMLRDGEQRGLLTARVTTPAGPIGIGCTHIDYREDDRERLQNVAELLQLVRERGLIAVGGDFNDLPGSRVHDAACRELIDCWREANGDAAGASYPAKAPQKRIDWLLRAQRAGIEGWRCRAARVVPTAASDHRAVLFELAREVRTP